MTSADYKIEPPNSITIVFEMKSISNADFNKMMKKLKEIGLVKNR